MNQSYEQSLKSQNVYFFFVFATFYDYIYILVILLSD